ncbi:MAG: sulfite exporter TauE/SafE family protein [Actinobacteria bacterium]|nr:sulfite exporter TauE/SafE family protein [Actinomycetota bacterium]
MGHHLARVRRAADHRRGAAGGGPVTAAIIAIILGVAGGFVAALAGVGGGILFVPALALVLGLTQVVAEATSLLAIVPVAILGTWQQRRTGDVHLRDALIIGAGSVVTSIIAAIVASEMPQDVLRWLFVALMVVIAARIWRGAERDATRGG